MAPAGRRGTGGREDLLAPRVPTTPMCDGALLEAFEPLARDSDVFVAAASKVGQTWLLALLHHLRTGKATQAAGAFR